LGVTWSEKEEVGLSVPAFFISKKIEIKKSSTAIPHAVDRNEDYQLFFSTFNFKTSKSKSEI
jgi:hypothetical protein